MWYSYSDKNQLLTLIKIKDPIIVYPTIKYTDSYIFNEFTNDDKFVVIWENEPKESALSLLPDAIYIENSKTLLAWVSTYIPIFKPFTSFCRILTNETINRSETKKILLDQQIQNGLIGIIIGETLTFLDNPTKKISLLSVRNTLSFYIARIINFGYEAQIDNLVAKWELLNLDKERKKNIKNPISIILSQAQVKTNILGISQDFIFGKSLFSSAYLENSILADYFKIKSNSFDINTMTREERYNLSETICKYLLTKTTHENSNLDSFFAAYFISQIAPGTFSQIEMAKKYATLFPELLIWYGFFVGINQKSEIRTSYNGLGWRIFNELIRIDPLERKPIGDISFEEYDCILNSQSKADLEFYTQNSTFINMEIYPHIYTPVKWANKEISTLKTDSSEQINLFNNYDDSYKIFYDSLMPLFEDFYTKFQNLKIGKKQEPKVKKYPKKKQ